MREKNKRLAETLPMSLNDEGLTSRTEEGRVRRQLFLQAVVAMFTARREAKRQAEAEAAAAKLRPKPAKYEAKPNKGGVQLDLFKN
jgi:hypothetical protein